MNTFGLKISPSPKNVLTSPNRDLVLNSQLGGINFPTAMQGIKSLSIPATSSATLTINHGLGYPPVFEAWLQDDTGVWHTVFSDQRPGDSASVRGSNNYGRYSDAQNISIQLTNSSLSTKTVPIYYLIFLNPTYG